MAVETPIHVLLVSFPAQGHVSPMLRLGKCLAARGCYVTFSTTKGTQKNDYTMNETSPTSIGDGFLSFEFFDDVASDADLPARRSLLDYTAHLHRIGKQVVSEMLKKHAEAKRPVSCIINNPFFSWVNDVAAEHGIPTALYWIHSAATFTACHRYFQKLSPFPTDSSPYTLVELPGGVVLKHSDIPDFLHPFSRTPFLKTLVRQQFENLSKTFCVLMDTFQELEQGYLDYLSQFHLVRPVGPLFKNPSSAALRNDDCIEWLNSKPRASVVYISLGTIVSLSVEQIGEFAHGLLNSRVSFLWVLSGSEREEALKANVMPDGFFERTSERGKVVQWSPQVEVLAHPSVACYLSHCGWNSTMEALASGVPVLTFSQISDQVTNAKFLVDVYGVGIRVRGDETEEKVISRDEIQRLLVEAMVGPKAEELKKNALKWKSAADAAWTHGGSSHRNLDAFVEDLKKLTHVTKITPQ